MMTSDSGADRASGAGAASVAHKNAVAVLLALGKAYPCAGLRELARSADVSVGSAARALDALEELGLAERTQSGASYASARFTAETAAILSNQLRLAAEFGPLQDRAAGPAQEQEGTNGR